MSNKMTVEKLLCGAELVCVGNKAEIRSRSVSVYCGTYRQAKAEAKRRGLLTSQSPSRSV